MADYYWNWWNNTWWNTNRISEHPEKSVWLVSGGNGRWHKYTENCLIISKEDGLGLEEKHTELFHWDTFVDHQQAKNEAVRDHVPGESRDLFGVTESIVLESFVARVSRNES